jgi:hypothetical protein
MSTVYTDNVKTHLIDPVYSRNNYRAEFRLQSGTAYMSNLRLCNLGIFGVNNKDYNAYTGTYGIIRQISLYDDSVLLDQQLEFPIWQAFQNYNKANQANMDLRSRLAVTQAGNYVLENAGSTSKIGTWRVNTLQTKTAEADAVKGWLDLKEVFPLLRNMTFIDTKFFKNLKVVIEFNTDVDQMLINTAGSAAALTCQLLMIADEVLVSVPAFKGVEYVGIEHDRVTLEAITVGTGAQIGDGTAGEGPKSAVVTNSFDIRGFENKTVGRCLISKQSNNSAVYKAANTNYRTGSVSSIANNKEVLQMTINGSQLIPGKGLQYDNQRLAMLSDVWGVCSSKPFMNGQAWRVRNDAADIRSNRTANGEREIGMLDFYGLNINSVVDTMHIDYDRQGVYVETNAHADQGVDDAFTANVAENVAQTFNIFCEVYKAIKPNGNGGYLVAYV